MFTGLILEKGKILRIKHMGQTIKLTCQASRQLLEDYQIGDSMAINGVCLTVVEKANQQFTVDIMPETFQRTTFSRLKINDEVNLERALPYNGRLEGHLVAGHVDGVTRLREKRVQENALVLTFDLPKEFQGEIISQGSIAINGVSLTVTQVVATNFSISLIPHSREQTNLGELMRGEYVNFETDMLGKYVKAQLSISKSIEWKELN
ncbi:riboflavin synthase [Enterococcus faecalis]|uniref:riboflavin synthase n=1 Tax=Enterococcus faecalis TaxID=1351 RepID=UPI00040E3C32|nr:riboflavin synthase [Enterococcus faecalis]MEB8141002.1 riboflavin synthase [Enterococcus faecalis]RTK51693.1 riboflavin synthase [Enterococcus faecalis]